MLLGYLCYLLLMLSNLLSQSVLNAPTSKMLPSSIQFIQKYSRWWPLASVSVKTVPTQPYIDTLQRKYILTKKFTIIVILRWVFQDPNMPGGPVERLAGEAWHWAKGSPRKLGKISKNFKKITPNYL